MMETQEEKKNWEGIMVGGKPLDDYFKSQKSNEVAAEVSSEFSGQNRKKKRIYVRPKYQDKKEEAGKMKTINQSQVNKEYLQRFLEQSKTLKEQLVCFLIAGEEFTAVDVQPRLIGKFSKQQIWNALTSLMASHFAQFVERKKVTVEGNKMFRYWSTKEGTELTPNEAHAHCKASAAKTPMKKGIKQAVKKKKRGKRISAGNAKHLQKKGDIHELVGKMTEELQKALDRDTEVLYKEIISLNEKLNEIKYGEGQTLNVVVGGSVDINFGFKFS
jgi:hypothetical protein